MTFQKSHRLKVLPPCISGPKNGLRTKVPFLWQSSQIKSTLKREDCKPQPKEM